MLTKVHEVYRDHGLVWVGPSKQGKLEAFIFPTVTASGEAVGSALAEVPSATEAEGPDVLRSRAFAVVDARLEKEA